MQKNSQYFSTNKPYGKSESLAEFLYGTFSISEVKQL